MPAVDRGDLAWIVTHLPPPPQPTFWARVTGASPPVAAEPIPGLQNGLLSAVDYLTKKNISIPPPGDFDCQKYLAMYQDVAASVEQGHFQTAYDHYIRYGRWEGRERA